MKEWPAQQRVQLHCVAADERIRGFQASWGGANRALMGDLKDLYENAHSFFVARQVRVLECPGVKGGEKGVWA